MILQRSEMYPRALNKSSPHQPQSRCSVSLLKLSSSPDPLPCPAVIHKRCYTNAWCMRSEWMCGWVTAPKVWRASEWDQKWLICPTSFREEVLCIRPCWRRSLIGVCTHVCARARVRPRRWGGTEVTCSAERLKEAKMTFFVASESNGRMRFRRFCGSLKEVVPMDSDVWMFASRLVALFEEA